MRANLLFLRIDLTIQSILLGLDAILLIAGIFDRSFFVLSMFFLLIIGAYQWLGSSLFALLFWKSPDERIRRIRQWHFWGSLAYITFLLVVESHHDFFIILGIGLPHVFAVLYAWLSWIDYRGRRSYMAGNPISVAF